jgi:peptidoglycan/LPS O-acetylase OafA/YrhL
VLIAMLYRGTFWNRFKSRWLWMALAVLALGMIPIALKPRSVLLDAIIRPSWVAFLFGCLLILALTGNSMLRNRYLGQFGTYAYCLYLVHFAVLKLAYRLFRQGQPKIYSLWDCWIPFLAVIVSCCFAAVSWKYFESPLLKIGHRVKFNTPITRSREQRSERGQPLARELKY